MAPGRIGSATAAPPESRALRIAVPAGMAVLSWAVLLVVVGVLAGVGSLTVSTLLDLLVVGAMAWSVATVAPWRPGVTARVHRFVSRRRRRLAVTAVLAAFAALVDPLGGPGVLATLLELPAWILTDSLYGASGLYREHVGRRLAGAVFVFGRGYVRLLWLYVLAGVVVALGSRLGRRP